MKQLPFLTLTLIVVSVVVALTSSFGNSEEALKSLFIAAPSHAGLGDIEAGEVWRLVTPIFIHFGPLHLLFNMMWIWDLGREIEARKGRWFLAGFVVAIGVAGNVAQYLATGPSFGGMSGVVYGLLAYIWIRNRLDANAGYTLHQYDVVTCVGWYFACWTGLLGPIGNWAHTAGLIGGLAWGYLETAPRSPIGRLGRLGRPAIYIALGCAIGAAALALFARNTDPGCGTEEGASPEQQIAICSKILESTTANAQTRSEILAERGKAYWFNGQHDLAIKDYDDAIALIPANAKALAGRGLAERDAGQAARGKGDIDRARQIDADIGEVFPALHYWDMTDAALAGIDARNSAAIDAAMRSVLRRVLAEMPPAAPSDGVPNERLIYFRTDVPGVAMSERLRAQYPKQLSLVLQYQYRDLVATPDTVSVTASFDGVWETIAIPLKAMIAFEDRTANFKFGFNDTAPQ